MNYAETLEYIYSQLPMFQRVGAAAYKANLDNTIALMKMLGNRQNTFKTIHIAGTNGKGSTSHMLAAMLSRQGYKTGLYTSPHLRDFRERIRIDGQVIPEQTVVDFVARYSKEFVAIQPSFFEITFAMAVDYFSTEKVDFVILETGMGGRLDSTNLVQAELSVITNIGMDHTQFLGDTLQKIAFEKAGIIKKETPVIIGQTQNETTALFTERAKELAAPIYFADQELEIKTKPAKTMLQFDVWAKQGCWLKDMTCDLLGNYQEKNLVTALTAARIFQKLGYKLSEKSIREGLQSVSATTGFIGRWQKIGEAPLTLCDTGHNVDGISYIVRQINETPHENLHFVLGMVNDKNIDHILSLLPKKATYYFCKADIPRGLNAQILAEKAHLKGLAGKVYTSVRQAVSSARSNAKATDLVFVGGSTFVVAEII